MMKQSSWNFLEVVEGRKRVFGMTMQRRSKAISNLASTYWSRGKYDEAEQLFLEVVEGRKRVFGDDHAETLKAISSLASTYWSRGRYDEAEQLELGGGRGTKASVWG
jgi:tetratricopeptide (TPR) repeat protein